MNSEAVLLLETVHFAAEKHRNQRRKDTEQTPYINHPIGTNVLTFLWRLQVRYANQITSEIKTRMKNNLEIKCFYINEHVYQSMRQEGL